MNPPRPLYRNAVQIIRRLRARGHQALLAGGCVRDRLMRRRPHDYDIATDATPDQVLALFPRTIPVGKKFGVILVVSEGQPYEVATFRSDSPLSDGRRPEQVTFTDARTDALRRDFTINGMFYDPVARQLLDYVGGRRDLEKKVVRTIGDPGQRFSEDFLRMLRAVRFSARLGYRLHPDTLREIRRQASSISRISAERIRDELTRILTGPNPGQALRLLRKTGLLARVLPEVDALAGVEQPPQFHPEGDVFTHVCLMLDQMRKPTETLAWAVLLHDVGKPATFRRASDRIRFSGHDVAGARLADAVCQRLRFSNDLRQSVVHCVRQHMRFMHVRQMRLAKLKRLMQAPTFADELALHRLDCLASHRDLSNCRFLRASLRQMAPAEIRPPRVLGGDDLIALGYTPGPVFKQILEAVETAQLENAVGTREEALAFIRERFPVSPETPARGK